MSSNVPAPTDDSGAAKDIALPLVTQAAAYLVQDGAAFLRGVTMVNLSGITVATKKFVETKDPTWLMVISGLMQTTQDAAKVAEAIATAAGKMIKEFESG